ncbi:MAG: 4-hydroxy-tetrahydrodipicolinate synthase [Thermoplasmata archaeon]
MRPFEGVYTPLITFFDAEGSLDISAQQRHVANLVKAGVHGLVPMASMGEFTSMDKEERRRVAEAVIGEASDKAKVVVGAGAASTREAVELSKDAEAAGADGVMVVTPFYIKPGLVGLESHYEAIRKEIEIPVMAYNLPSFTGFDLPAELVLKMARQGTIQGLKDSSGNMAKAIQIITEMPQDFSFMTGFDPLFASMVLHGGQGGVIGSSNVFPSETVDIFNLIQKGRIEEAVKLQLLLARFTQALGVGTFPAAAKFLVEKVWGLKAYSRPPVMELTAEEKRSVLNIVKPLLP